MRQRGVNRRLLGLMGAGVLLVILQSLGALGPFASATQTIARPFQSVLSGAGNTASGWWSVVTSAGSLERENQKLRLEVAGLKQQLSQDTELRAQNEELRKQLGLGAIQPNRLLAAEVISYQPDNFRQFVTVARGGKDGIKPGMAVVQQGKLLGTIQEVSENTSKVFLVIDPSFRVAVIDQDAPNRPTGTVHGQIGSGLVMDKIAQTETVKPGDTIVTSGLGSDVEKGLIVGKVQAVDKKDNGVFQTAQVATDIQFNRLEIVYIIVRTE